MISYKDARELFDKVDLAITSWMGKQGVKLLRISLAIVFIWFGIAKPLGWSPAGDLVQKMVYLVNPDWFIPFLGWWEVAIGVCLFFKPLIRLGILLMGLQMIGTFIPLVLLPDIVYQNGKFFALTLEGQYIVKNIVLISAAIVVGSGVREK